MPPSSTSVGPSSNGSVSSLTSEAVSESPDKIFGMENFGYTCYCNSVLQCLYYLKPFREQILSFARDAHTHKRRAVTVGTKPHPFQSDPANASLSGSGVDTANAPSAPTPLSIAMANAQAQQEARMRAQASGQTEPAVNEPKKGQLSLGRRLSLFGGGKKDDKSKSDNLKNNGNLTSPNDTSNINSIHANGSSNDDTQDYERHASADSNASGAGASHDEDQLPYNLLFDSNNPVSYADYKMLYPALRGLTLGMRVPTQNSPVVGYTDDPFATPEIRKRAALTRGPIVNLDHSYSNEYGMSETMFTSLKDIFDCMAESKSRIGVVSPSALIEVLKKTNELFRSSMHQDAHEFLNYIMNDVVESLDKYSLTNKDKPNTDSKWVHELLEGLLTSETKCLTCETVSRRDEQFLDLSIDIERNTSVTSCLRQFSASEMLCESNKFNCDNCGGFHEAQKRMKIKKLPKLLALHLKRFKFTEDMQRNVKLFHKVVYPRYLRLFNTTDDCPDPEKLYELSSIIVHIGGGPYHGHYVSVVKTENAGWLLFDDEMVESVDPNYVFSFFGDNNSLATAYVLFYQEITQEQYEQENLYANTSNIRQPASNGAHEKANVSPSNGNGPYSALSANGHSTGPAASSTISTLSTQVEETPNGVPAPLPVSVPSTTSSQPIPLRNAPSSGNGEFVSRPASPKSPRSVPQASPPNLFVPKRGNSPQENPFADPEPFEPSISPNNTTYMISGPTVTHSSTGSYPSQANGVSDSEMPTLTSSTSKHSGLSIGRFKSTSRRSSTKEHSKSVDESANGNHLHFNFNAHNGGNILESTSEETNASPEKSKRKSRHLSFGFNKKH